MRSKIKIKTAVEAENAIAVVTPFHVWEPPFDMRQDVFDALRGIYLSILNEKLTPEQEAAIPGWRDKWIAHGLCCEPADFETAEKAIRACYVFAGLAEPETVVSAGSPYVTVTAGAIAGHCIENQKRPHFDDIKKIAGHLADDVFRITKEAINGKVPQKADKETYTNLKSAIQQNWTHYIGGQSWPWLPAFESYFREVCDLVLPGDLSERGKAYATIAQSCGWVWLHERIAIVSDRPAWIDMRNRRLHSVDRAAIAWRDGFKIYQVDGISVPPEWIEEKEKLDPKRCLTETNAEHRQALTQIVGWTKVLDHVKCREIVRDEWGAILATDDLGDDEGKAAHFIELACPSTGRIYRERIPPEITDPRTALAWRSHPDRPEVKDVNPEWYAPNQQA